MKYNVNSSGFYGDFGGAYIPEMLFSNIDELNKNYLSIVEKDSFKKELSQGSVLFFGDGANKCQNILSHPNANFELGIYPSASNMIFIAYNKYENKEFEDLAYFEPFYLKDFLSGVNT